MKKVFLLIVFCLFLMVSNSIGADLSGFWEGSMICSNDSNDGRQIVWIVQNAENDTFEVLGTYSYLSKVWDTDREFCSGVVDGNKFYMSCDGGGQDNPDAIPSFSHGEIKGKVLYAINYVPIDGKACKGVYNKKSEEDLPDPPPLP